MEMLCGREKKKKEKKVKYKICKSEEKRLKFFNYTVRNFSGKKGCKGGDEKREREGGEGKKYRSLISRTAFTHISKENKKLMDVITLSCSGLKNSNLITTPAGHSSSLSPSVYLSVHPYWSQHRCWWITVTLIYYKNDLAHRRTCSFRLT